MVLYGGGETLKKECIRNQEFRLQGGFDGLKRKMKSSRREWVSGGTCEIHLISRHH